MNYSKTITTHHTTPCPRLLLQMYWVMAGSSRADRRAAHVMSSTGAKRPPRPAKGISPKMISVKRKFISRGHLRADFVQVFRNDDVEWAHYGDVIGTRTPNRINIRVSWLEWISCGQTLAYSLGGLSAHMTRIGACIRSTV